MLVVEGCLRAGRVGIQEGLDQCHPPAAQVGAGLAQIGGTDGEALPVVGSRNLHVGAVSQHERRQFGQRGLVGRLGLGGGGDRRGGPGERIVIGGTLRVRLQPADEEGVGGQGVGSEQVHLEVLDADHLVGVGSSTGGSIHPEDELGDGQRGEGQHAQGRDEAPAGERRRYAAGRGQIGPLGRARGRCRRDPRHRGRGRAVA